MIKYLILLLPSLAFAQFTNFPLAEHYTNADWNVINAECHPFKQLWDATIERARLINNGKTPETEPISTNFIQIVHNNTVYAGTTKTVYTVGSWTYTNETIITSNIITTNCFTNFYYTYGTNTGLVTPYLSYYDFYVIDFYLYQLGGYFYRPTEDTYEARLQNSNQLGEFDSGLMTLGGIMYTSNVGIVESTVSNSFGEVYDAVSYFSKGFSTTGRYSLATGRYGTGVWSTVVHRTMPTRNNNTAYPVAQWSRGGTNAFRNTELTVIGNVAGVSTSVTYNISSTNFALDAIWQSVSAISGTNGSANTNDTYEIVYTNRFLVADLYSPFDSWIGDDVTHWGTMKLFDERYKVLTNMVWTGYRANAGGPYNHPNIQRFSRGWLFDKDYEYPTSLDPLADFISDWTSAKPSANWTYTTNTFLGSYISIRNLTNSTPPPSVDALYATSYEADEGIAGLPVNVCSNFSYYYYRYCLKTDTDYTGNYAYLYNPTETNGDLVYSGTQADLIAGTNILIVPLTFWQDVGSSLSPGEQWSKRKSSEVWYFDWSAGLKYK